MRASHNNHCFLLPVSYTYIMHYCMYAPHDPVHASYHDTEYGFPVRRDSVLFERLVLEINQAGLSWGTILKKRKDFARVYIQYDIKKITHFTEHDIARLMQDATIIRNERKIRAVIRNASVVLDIQQSHGSFSAWIEKNREEMRELGDWVKLFKRHFVFVGPLIVQEFLLSTGILPDAHLASCEVANDVTAQMEVVARKAM